MQFQGLCGGKHAMCSLKNRYSRCALWREVLGAACTPILISALMIALGTHNSKTAVALLETFEDGCWEEG